MVVLILQTVPEKLRWDVTKWLAQIGVGVYVGHLTAPLREHLWLRVVEFCKSGEAIMVWSSNTEQGYDFYVHNLQRRIVDFDGLKYLLKPFVQSEERTSSITKLRAHAKSQFFKRFVRSNLITCDYTVIDVETTGLDLANSQIIEVAALRVRNGVVVDSFSKLIQISGGIPQEIVELTGITQEMLASAHVLSDVLSEFKLFIGFDLLVGYGIRFDLSFLNKGFVDSGFSKLKNRFVDVMLLMKGLYPGLKSYKLFDVLHFCINSGIIDFDIMLGGHRARADCEGCMALYQSVYDLMIADS